MKFMLMLLVACGGNVAPMPEPAPVATAPVSPPVTVFPPTAPINVPAPDAGALVCTYDDGTLVIDLACDIQAHAFWRLCADQSCVQLEGCDQAIKHGTAHPGDFCVPLSGERGIVNVKQ